MTKCYVRQRIVLAVMLFLGFTVEYMMRNLLSIAITQIAKRTFTNTSIISGDVCPIDNETFTDDSNNGYEQGSTDGLYEWSETLQGVILSSFYWGYIITHIPGGMLVERFGGKVMLLAAIVVTSVLTCLTPLSITLGGAYLLIGNRVVMGLCQGFIYAAVYGLMATWIPLRERTTLGIFVLSGISLGSILSNYLSGLLLQYLDGWQWPFYIYSIVAIVWCVFFALFCSRDPQSNHFLVEEEKVYLQNAMGMLQRDADLPLPPYRAILTSRPVWAIIACQTGIDFWFYIMTSDLPKYLSDVMRFNVESNGLYSALALVLSFTSGMLFGVLSDFCVNRKYLSVKNTRRFFTTSGKIGLAICFILASYSGCNRLYAVLFISFASGFAGIDNSRVNCMDLSPNYAPTIVAIVNSFGSAMGIFAPLIVGLLTPNATIYECRVVFWIVFGVVIATSVIYYLFADGEIQHWNNPKRSKKRSLDYGTSNQGMSNDIFSTHL